MIRIAALALAAFAIVAPATAQQATLLTGDAWECRVVPLAGQPAAGLLVQYEPAGSLVATMSMEMMAGADFLSVEVDIASNWALRGAVVEVVTTGVQVINAWRNDEEIPFDQLEELSKAVAEALMRGPTESTIAYIAEHALVLSESDASVSCWR